MVHVQVDSVYIQRMGQQQFRGCPRVFNLKGFKIGSGPSEEFKYVPLKRLVVGVSLHP